MNELVRQLDDHTKLCIIEAITAGDVHTAEDIVEYFGSAKLSLNQAVALLNDEEFYSQICDYTQAGLRLLFHSNAVSVLSDVLLRGDNRERLAAYDRLGKAVGTIKDNPVHVHLSLEDYLEGRNISTRNGSDLASDTIIPLKKVSGNIFEVREQASQSESVEEGIEYLFEEEDELEFLNLV